MQEGEKSVIPNEVIANKIYLIRNQKVLLDAINSVQAMQLTKEDKDAMLNEAKIFSWGNVAKSLKTVYENIIT